MAKWVLWSNRVEPNVKRKKKYGTRYDFTELNTLYPIEWKNIYAFRYIIQSQ